MNDDIYNESAKLFDTFVLESDRASAILGLLLIEDLLKEFVTTSVNKIDNDVLLYIIKQKSFLYKDPLNHLEYFVDSKILHKNINSSLSHLIKIRNKFAHYKNIHSFDTRDIEEICKQFNLAKKGSENYHSKFFKDFILKT